MQNLQNLQSLQSLQSVLASGRLSRRLWMVATFRCNLACSFCLTGSHPKAPPRALDAARMIRLARQARELGFESLGVTGGEPFVLPWMAEAAEELSAVLPTAVLCNGLLLKGELLARVKAWAGRPIRLQVSLDYASEARNDAVRGPGAWRGATTAIRDLARAGVRVHVATTVDPDDPPDREALSALIAELGGNRTVHFERPMVRRGRAAIAGFGVPAGLDELPAELTITADGAWWSPFATTVRDGRPDTDLLLTRTIEPLAEPAREIAARLLGRPPGSEATLDIL